MKRSPETLPLSLEQMLEQGLSQVRTWLIFAAALGAIGTWLGTLLLVSRPTIPVYDVALNILSGTILVGAVAWLIFGRGPLLRFSIILLSIETLIVTVRMVAALIVSYSETSLSEALPPLSPWVPLFFVVAFLLLPAREALYFSCAPMVILMIATLVFVLRNFGSFGASFEMMNIVQQYLFMHPLLVLLLYLISRIAQKQREDMAVAYAREAEQGRWMENDDWINGLSRPGMLHQLDRILANLDARNRAVLINCHLRSCGRLLDERGERVVRKRVRALAEGLLRHLDAETRIGRLDSAHLLILVPWTASQTQGPEQTVDKLRRYAVSGFPDLDVDISAMFLEPGMTSEIALQALELETLTPAR